MYMYHMHVHVHVHVFYRVEEGEVVQLKVGHHGHVLKHQLGIGISVGGVLETTKTNKQTNKQTNHLNSINPSVNRTPFNDPMTA